MLLGSVKRLTRAGEPSTSAPAHPLFERALVVDGSSVARQLLAWTLRIHCAAIETTTSLAEAGDLIDEGVSLVVLDAAIPGALAWFEERCARPLRPAFVIVTNRPSQEEETRATLVGAIGYLAKPISLRELSHVLVTSTGSFDPTRAGSP